MTEYGGDQPITGLVAGHRSLLCRPEKDNLPAANVVIANAVRDTGRVPAIPEYAIDQKSNILPLLPRPS